jgi:hypothetical protein
MGIRRLLAVMAVVSAFVGIVGASTASANSAIFFNKTIQLNSFAVSGTPRETLFAGGGELKETTGTWTFCTAANPNGTSELRDKVCATGLGFIETYGTQPARAWVEVKIQKGFNRAHLVAEEFW